MCLSFKPFTNVVSCHYSSDIDTRIRTLIILWIWLAQSRADCLSFTMHFLCTGHSVMLFLLYRLRCIILLDSYVTLVACIELKFKTTKSFTYFTINSDLLHSILNPQQNFYLCEGPFYWDSPLCQLYWEVFASWVCHSYIYCFSELSCKNMIVVSCLIITLLYLHVHYWNEHVKFLWEFLLELMVIWIISQQIILSHPFPCDEIVISDSLTLDLVIWLTWANRMEMEVTADNFWSEALRALASFL